jgi:hypothetical protein
VTETLTAGFTAARDLDSAGEGVILNVLVCHVPHADRYVTGGAIGGDAFIGRWLLSNRPDAEHVVIVPGNWSRVDRWWPPATVKVVMMPPHSTYAARNARIVEESAMVFGFPGYPEDDPRSARSGTWQTIRMARKAAKLSQWACVQPPYRGRIEAYPFEFGYQGGESAP